jgi:hypothetical protein
MRERKEVRRREHFLDRGGILFLREQNRCILGQISRKGGKSYGKEKSESF